MNLMPDAHKTVHSSFSRSFNEIETQGPRNIKCDYL